MKKSELVRDTFHFQGLIGVFRLGLEYIVLKFRPTNNFLLPNFLQIEPTINCNLRCEMCDRATWNRTCEDMPLLKYRRLISQFKYLRSLKIQGMGEPLLHKKLVEMIDYAKKCNVISVRTVTNATVLDEKMARKLLNSEIDVIGISLDSADEKVYECIRKGAKFQETIRNIKYLVELNNSRPNKKEIHIGMTCDLNSIDGAIRVLELVNKLGVKSFSITGIHTWGKKEWEDKKGDAKLSNDIKKTKEIIDKIEKKAKEYGVHFYPFLVSNKGRICTWPWMGAYITADGFVTPCGIHGTDPKKFNFGNVFERSFKDIWNSEKYKDFRKRMKRGEVPKFCENCPEL